MRACRSCSNPSFPDREDRAAEILETLFGPYRAARRLSDVEIAQLVSVALNDALFALDRSNPKGAVASRAEEVQSGLHEQFRALPRVQRTDPTVLAEYRKAVVFEALTCDPALELVEVIRRYAAASECNVPGHVT